MFCVVTVLQAGNNNYIALTYYLIQTIRSYEVSRRVSAASIRSSPGFANIRKTHTRKCYVTVIVDIISVLKHEVYTNKVDILGLNYQTTRAIVRKCRMWHGLVNKQKRVTEKIEDPSFADRGLSCRLHVEAPRGESGNV